MAALSEVHGQVSDDQSSAFHGGAISVTRYNIWAVGASLGYNFGPAQLTVGALDEGMQTFLGIRHS